MSMSLQSASYELAGKYYFDWYDWVNGQEVVTQYGPYNTAWERDLICKALKELKNDEHS